jgi:hypothetical protein
MKLDYTLQTALERTEFVKQLCAERSDWSSFELKQMADYILAIVDATEKREILTSNRMVTINKREVSYQALSEQLEGGEDALHALFRDNKNTLLSPRIFITEEDIQTIPGLKDLREDIAQQEIQFATAKGMEKFRIKKAIIEMRKQQYLLKASAKPPTYSRNTNKTLSSLTNCNVRLSDPEEVSFLLVNYSKLKAETWENLESDLRWALIDLDNLIEQYIRIDYPLYYDLIQMKIDGLQNVEIQEKIQELHGRQHSQEYISSIWRNKIPWVIAEGEKENWLNWVYLNRLPGQYKACTRCGEIKLAHQRYFSINKSAKYGFYSICKKCRNKQGE